MTRFLAALALACALALPAHASDCPQHYQADTPPAVASVNPGTVELCNEAYAVSWSPATRDPVFAAEHLTAAGLISADKTKRHDAFHAEMRLLAHGAALPALLADYRRSRFDRGHMAPAHDMPTPAAMRESFSLANMVPQSKPLNRGPWAQIEEAVRSLVVPVFQGEGFVVTGPIFAEGAKKLRGRVAIPDRLFKAIYVPGDRFGNTTTVGAWIVANAAKPETRFVSIAALTAETGVDPFPGLPPDLRDKVLLSPETAKRTGVAGGL